MEMSSNYNEELIHSVFERDQNLTESNFSNPWNDPFDSVWLKLITILVYFIELVASMIMMAFVEYETKGLFGHYRTLINQLLSHLYGGVSICESLQ